MRDSLKVILQAGSNSDVKAETTSRLETSGELTRTLGVKITFCVVVKQHYSSTLKIKWLDRDGLDTHRGGLVNRLEDAEDGATSQEA